MIKIVNGNILDAKNGRKPTEMTKPYVKGYNEGLILRHMLITQKDF